MGKALCAAHPCSLCWPETPGSHCDAKLYQYINVTLRNITVNGGAGGSVVLANASSPMQNLVFEDVRFNNPGKSHWGDDYYYCKNAGNAVAKGSTWPVPPCFKDQTGTCVKDGQC